MDQESQSRARPIYLFADSQLLFWRPDDDEQPFLERARREIEAERPKAAYVGASNGDRLEFYRLFQGAMAGIGIDDTRMIPSEPSDDDVAYFEAADLVLLAGGDPRRGLAVMRDNGLASRVREIYHRGALLIGISAGAVQLGLEAWSEEDGERVDALRLLPLVIDVHQEPEWQRLAAAMPRAGEYVQGLGIPSGGGAVVEPDMTVEPVRRPLVEMSYRDDEVRRNLILPPGGEAPGGEAGGDAPEA